MIAWVLGASGAWGRAMALDLSARGYDIVALGRRTLPEAQAWAAACGRVWEHLPFDLTAPSTTALPPTAPDVLICAGASTLGTRADLIQANYLAVAELADWALERMRARGAGRVGIFLGQNARLGMAGIGDYSASQAALWTWAESRQAELRGAGVTLTRVIPPRTASPTQRFLAERSGHHAALGRPSSCELVDGILAGRRQVGRRPWLASLAMLLR